jgi:hypothetical protein
MSSEQVFQGVPGVPDGWELVHACRQAESAEHYLNNGGYLSCATCRTSACYPIIRKIEQPARYRQFANAEEFDAFNHLRFREKDRKSERRLASYYDSQGLRMNDGNSGSYLLEWEACFARLEFVDGTPFGVKIES